MKRFSLSLFPVIFFLFISLSLQAGNTGKISGRVTDKETREPLPFANILIEGTTMGAVTDIEGKYFILNVRPGTYIVRAEMMGYQPVKKTDALVKTDQNCILDFELSTTVLKVEDTELTITAERPMIERDVTSSLTTVTSEKIEQLPVNNVNEILDIQAGVVNQGGELHFRGGRGSESLYLVDGMAVRDAVTGGGGTVNIGTAAIEEIKVMTGGFDAEYGEAQSAIVNVTMKEGSSEFSGSLKYKTDDFGSTSLNDYSFNSDYVEMMLSGPEPITTFLLPKLGVKFPGKELTFIMTATGDYSDTYTPYNYKKPSHEFLGINFHDRMSNKLNFTSKLIYKMSSIDKFTLSLLKSWNRTDPYYHSFYYNPIYSRYKADEQQFQVSLKWNHTMSSKSFMEYQIARTETKSFDHAGMSPTEFPLEPDPTDPQTLPWEEASFNNWENQHINADYPEPWADGDILIDGSEPWQDYGADGIPGTFDAGEGDGDPTNDTLTRFTGKYEDKTAYYFDYGLDGIPGTGDYGEGDGVFNTYNSFPDFGIYTVDYIDLNGNGKYDVSERDAGMGEWFEDRNNNGYYDPPNGRYDEGEPFYDITGDGQWTNADGFLDGARDAEPFTDVNKNGVFDPGEKYTDVNKNGRFDAGEPYFDYGYDQIPNTGDYGEGNHKFDINPYDPSIHEKFIDLNGNGNYDAGEPFEDGEQFVEDSFTDNNGNGKFNAESEKFTDLNGNGVYDVGEEFIDGPNGLFDIGEPYFDVGLDGVPRTEDFGENNNRWDYQDTNKNGKFDPGEPHEPFYDSNGDGTYTADYSDIFWDVGVDGIPNTHDVGEGNGKYDLGEPFLDRIGDGEWDQADTFIDRDGDGFYGRGEPFYDWGPDQDPNVYDPGQFNGVYDPGEKFDDYGRDGIPNTKDPGEGNGRYDGPLANGIWDPGEPYYDSNGNGIFDGPNGKWDDDEPFTDKNFNGSWDKKFEGAHDQWSPYDYHTDIVWTFKGTFTSQISSAHQVTSGLEMKYHDLEQGEIQYPYRRFVPTEESPGTTGPYPGRGIFRNFWDAKPWEGDIYAQDLFEYEDLILKVGLRYDFWILGATAPDTLKKTVEDKLSPRLAISYPISLHDKMKFSYGHFSQMPPLELVYNSNEQGASALALKGNYALRSPKTVAYEFGIEHAFSDDVKLDVKGFFKDQRDLIQATKVKDPRTAREEYIYMNSDYGNARGIEVNLDKRYSNHTSGNISYTYQFAMGKNSREMDSYPKGNPTPEEFPLDWDQRHSLNINMDLRFADGEYLKISKYRLFDNWGLNMVWQLGSGLPFTPTYSGNAAGPRNSERKPWTSNVDVIANKDFKFAGLDYSLLLEISNLFDRKNVYTVNTDYRTPEGDGRFISLNPRYYYPGRQIEFGFEVKF